MTKKNKYCESILKMILYVTFCTLFFLLFFAGNLSIAKGNVPDSLQKSLYANADGNKENASNETLNNNKNKLSETADFDVVNTDSYKTSCKVTLSSDLGDDSISADKEAAQEGETVTITVKDEKYGYKFEGLNIVDVDGVNICFEVLSNKPYKASFNMPAKEVAAHARFTTVALSDKNKIEQYKGTMVWKNNDIVSSGKPATVNCCWGFDFLTKYNNCLSCKGLAETSLMLANSTYYRAGAKADVGGSYVAFGGSLDDHGGPDFNIYYNLGFTDVACYDIKSDDTTYEADDVTSIYIAYKPVCLDNGDVVNCYACAVRGTDGTYKEWSSNFDVGANTNDYWARKASHWKNKTNHKGFEVCAELIMERIKCYTREHNASTGNGAVCDKNYILITGHSRGASIANLVGAKIIDDQKSDGEFSKFIPFTYTFAAPLNTTNANAKSKDYDSIFNIVNEDDIVPTLPYSDWGFKIYGKVISESIKNNSEWEKELKKLVGWKVYNSATSVQRSSLRNNGKAMATNREELYKIPDSDEQWNKRQCVYHLYSWFLLDLEKRAKFLTESDYGKFCKVEIKKQWYTPKYVEVRPSPAFCMHYMALLIDDSNYLTNSPSEVEIDGIYNNWRWFFISCGATGQIIDAHCAPAYYTILEHVTEFVRPLDIPKVYIF